jgi:hypothetical protein
MVVDSVWTVAGEAAFLCIGCLESRLERALVPADFPGLPINDPSPWDTDRLASRKSGSEH